MDLLNKHNTTVSTNKYATKCNTYNKEHIAVTKQVYNMDHCTLECRDMATQECRHWPMEHWFDKRFKAVTK